jgi:hypothetical protein
MILPGVKKLGAETTKEDSVKIKAHREINCRRDGKYPKIFDRYKSILLTILVASLGTYASDSFENLTTSDTTSTSSFSALYTQHSFQLELLGLGGLYSLNYEFGINFVKLRLGISVLKSSLWPPLDLPFSISICFPDRRKSQFEIGAGCMTLIENQQATLIPVPIAGYRGNFGSHFIFRVYFSPIIYGYKENSGGSPYFPWGGLAIGIRL